MSALTWELSHGLDLDWGLIFQNPKISEKIFVSNCAPVFGILPRGEWGRGITDTGGEGVPRVYPVQSKSGFIGKAGNAHNGVIQSRKSNEMLKTSVYLQNMSGALNGQEMCNNEDFGLAWELQ